jgi:hypothetical protein
MGTDPIHVIEPIKNLTLSISGQKIQVATGRLDYYSSPSGTYVTVRPNAYTGAPEPLVLAVAPADAGRRVFGRQGSLRLLGYAAAATDPDEIDPGVMSWSQVCSCNAARLKRELLSLEPVLIEHDVAALFGATVAEQA